MARLTGNPDEDGGLGGLEAYFEAERADAPRLSAGMRQAILRDADAALREMAPSRTEAREPAGSASKQRSFRSRLRLALVFAGSAAAGLGTGYAVAGSEAFDPGTILGGYESAADPDVFTGVEGMLLGDTADG